MIRNENGTLIIDRARSVGQNTISMAECLLFRDGIWMANSRGFKQIIVERDSKLVIESIYGVYDHSS